MKIKKTILSIIMILAMICSSYIPVFATEENDDFVFTTSYNPFADTNNSNSRNIIGLDNRTIITNTDDYPYSAIAKLDIAYNCGCTGKGTGFMISERCMLTAGHCLVCNEEKKCTGNNKSVASITAYFGFKEGSNSLLMTIANQNNSIIYCNPQYLTSNYDNNYDCGYVVFNTDIGNTTGWFGLVGINDSGLDGLSIQVAGYVDNVLYKGAGNITSVTNTRIKYDADTESGESGGPVYANFAAYGYMAVGIHTTGASLLNWRNAGWRITSSFIDALAAQGYVTKAS